MIKLINLLRKFTEEQPKDSIYQKSIDFKHIVTHIFSVDENLIQSCLTPQTFNVNIMIPDGVWIYQTSLFIKDFSIHRFNTIESAEQYLNANKNLVDTFVCYYRGKLLAIKSNRLGLYIDNEEV